MNTRDHRGGLRLRPSIDRYGRAHLFEQRPPGRYAADLDEAGRAALQTRDRRTDAILRRINAWILLPATATWLILPHTAYALPMPIAIGVLNVLAVSIVAFNQLGRCPNCHRLPQRCVDFCPACGERALVPDAYRKPFCTACCTHCVASRGRRRFPLRWCSTCGLKLGRRDKYEAA